jgi:hypothetical protein
MKTAHPGNEVGHSYFAELIRIGLLISSSRWKQ